MKSPSNTQASSYQNVWMSHIVSKKQNKLCNMSNSGYLYFQMNRAKLPYWKMTLLNVCNLVNNINNQVGETVEVDEEDLVSGRQFPAALDGFSLEAVLTVYQLEKLCHSRAFQHWEVKQSQIHVSTAIKLSGCL